MLKQYRLYWKYILPKKHAKVISTKINVEYIITEVLWKGNVDEGISKILIAPLIWEVNINEVTSRILITEVIWKDNIDEVISKILITEVIFQGNIGEVISKILITEVIWESNIDKVISKILITEVISRKYYRRYQLSNYLGIGGGSISTLIAPWSITSTDDLLKLRGSDILDV